MQQMRMISNHLSSSRSYIREFGGRSASQDKKSKNPRPLPYNTHTFCALLLTDFALSLSPSLPPTSMGILSSFLLAGILSVSTTTASVCRSPLNEHFETPCSTTVATKGPVSIRRYGTEETVTLVMTSDLDPALPLFEGLDFGTLMILKYFTNSPGGQASAPGVLLNRTAPLTIRKDADKGWTVWMAAAHSQFPDGPEKLPKPGQYEELSAVLLPGSTGQGNAAYFAVVNVTTASLPTEAEWLEGCALATAPGALPHKFVLDTAAPFPGATLALYNQAGHSGPWTSECWVGVRPRAK